MKYRIQEVSEKLQVPRSTIRYWETVFHEHVQPRRTNGGQRRYTAENISMIEEIKRMRGSGMGLAEIKRKLGNSNSMRNHNLDSNKMDLLAMRVAEVVRAEISSFFQRENLKSKFYEADE